MIIKSFETNKINTSKNNIILMYGKNEGLKKQLTDKLTSNFNDIQIYEEKEILDDSNNFLENVLKNSPHSVDSLIHDWNYPYSKEKAFYPNSQTKRQKYWPPVGRVDNVYGDRNLVCTCPSIKEFK